MTDAGSLRVGHGEREHVVHVLMQQYAEGRLTAGELDRLSAQARAARTFADLDGLVADLPVTPPSVELRRTATTSDLALLGNDPDHRLVLSGGMSSHVRRGVWTVPAYLQLNAGMATVKLDFQQAICPHAVVDIAVSAGLGAVVLVVPEGWGANTDQVSKGFGSVVNRVDAVPQLGQPLLVLHGGSGAGAIRVRHPTWHDRRQVRRSVRRGGIDGAAVSGAGSRPSLGPPPRPVATGWPAGPQDAPVVPKGSADGPH